jgi:hypothetical protein
MLSVISSSNLTECQTPDSKCQTTHETLENCAHENHPFEVCEHFEGEEQRRVRENENIILIFRSFMNYAFFSFWL